MTTASLSRSTSSGTAANPKLCPCGKALEPRRQKKKVCASCAAATCTHTDRKGRCGDPIPEERILYLLEEGIPLDEMRCVKHARTPITLEVGINKAGEPLLAKVYY